MKISDADSAENNSGSSHYLVTPLSCSLPNRREGGPKASGEERLKILPGSRLHSICGSDDSSEQYYCNYGVNEEYERQFQAAGLRVSARGIQGETRAVELPNHRFFYRYFVSAAAFIAPGGPTPFLALILARRDAIPESALPVQRRTCAPGQGTRQSRRAIGFLVSFRPAPPGRFAIYAAPALLLFSSRTGMAQ